MGKIDYLDQKADEYCGTDQSLRDAFFSGARVAEEYLKSARKKREVCRCRLSTYYVEDGINYCLKCDLPLP